MNYYPHHIGDFDKATRHLTRIERSVYRDLLDVYYHTELPLTLDLVALCRKILARTDEERTAVEQTLNEFFTKTEAGWMSERCETEIALYHKKLDSASGAGKASAAKRAAEKAAALKAANEKASADQQSSESGCNANPTAVERPLNGEATNQNQNQNQNQDKPKEQGTDTSGQAGITAAPAPQDASAQGTRIPKAWVLPVEWRDWAVAERPDWPGGHAERVAAAFRDYWVAVPGKAGRKADWQATWRNWVRKERGAGGPPQGKQTNSNGADRHGNFGAQDYRAGVTADGFF